MNEKPLISVIMGAYNCEDTIEQSIDSILKQTYSNWEMIICDDCSTDGTYEVLKRRADSDNRIKIILNERNMKLPATLNHCLKNATGEFIARMDSDDISFPERFEKQLRILDEHPEIAVVGGAIVPFDDFSEKKVRVPKIRPVALDLIKDVPFYHPTIMMRKSVYDDLGGYTEKKRTIKGQDLDLWFRFFSKKYEGYNLQTPVLKYHESITDYKKKRNYSAAWGMVQTRWIGFRLNHFPFYVYPLVFKPLISVIMPKRLMHAIHNRNK